MARSATGLLAATALAVACLLAPDARATVTEPSGTVVPLDSKNGEAQLYTFFAKEGEPIDWLKDANTTPDTFSPLCGFEAKFMLHEAGGKFDVGWYNADPKATVAPPKSEIYTLVPAGSAVGTVVKGKDIRTDPRYKGGLIGFALLAGQIHYSEQKWNVACGFTCPKPGPWAVSLTYQSKKIPNAYYLAFEDGDVSAFSFGNDGDFNDDVFLFTGLACAGAGMACDTGKKGICARGATSCVDGKVTCVDASLPAAKRCNGLDNDCDGKIDDGPCPDGTICTRGACLPKCNSGEFKCGPGLVCDTTGLCIDPPCVGKTCPDGKTCVKGDCVDACSGVTCPKGQLCMLGACLDPCTSLKCGTDEVCEDGLCKMSCDCAGCPTGKTCDKTSRRCIPPKCAGVTCPKGSYCADDGTCKDACAGAICPIGQACVAGTCVAAPTTTDAGVEEDASFDAALGEVSFAEDTGVIDDASLAIDAGKDKFSDPDVKKGAGCACTTSPSRGIDFSSIFALVALLGLVALRRER